MKPSFRNADLSDKEPIQGRSLMSIILALPFTAHSGSTGVGSVDGASSTGKDSISQYHQSHLASASENSNAENADSIQEGELILIPILTCGSDHQKGKFRINNIKFTMLSLCSSRLRW